tara:strand:+ start:363 stop:641 length:279 start_codon:yes stop_codon:yes gene_type:complete
MALASLMLWLTAFGGTMFRSGIVLLSSFAILFSLMASTFVGLDSRATLLAVCDLGLAAQEFIQFQLGKGGCTLGKRQRLARLPVLNSANIRR